LGFFHIFPIFSLFNLLFFCKKNKLNSEMIWKIWKKSRLNCEMIWTIWKKGKLKCEMIWTKAKSNSHKKWKSRLNCEMIWKNREEK
jgi:hypothetical protein